MVWMPAGSPRHATHTHERAPRGHLPTCRPAQLSHSTSCRVPETETGGVAVCLLAYPLSSVFLLPSTVRGHARPLPCPGWLAKGGKIRLGSLAWLGATFTHTHTRLHPNPTLIDYSRETWVNHEWSGMGPADFARAHSSAAAPA